MLNLHVSEECLRNLPIGKFYKFDMVPDMDNKVHIAIVWSFLEYGETRYASFDSETGEYLGEHAEGTLNYIRNNPVVVKRD
jgi:hypothetical protein